MSESFNLIKGFQNPDCARVQTWMHFRRGPASFIRRTLKLGLSVCRTTYTLAWRSGAGSAGQKSQTQAERCEKRILRPSQSEASKINVSAWLMQRWHVDRQSPDQPFGCFNVSRHLARNARRGSDEAQMVRMGGWELRSTEEAPALVGVQRKATAEGVRVTPCCSQIQARALFRTNGRW